MKTCRPTTRAAPRGAGPACSTGSARSSGRVCPMQLVATAPVISISGLGKTYASGLRALDGIDLEIRKGEIFALLGPNGAGKTTLINVVCGIVTPTCGTVEIGRASCRERV